MLFAPIIYTNKCYDRFTNLDDIKWMDKTQGRVINEDLGEDLGAHLSKTLWFVDFLR